MNLLRALIFGLTVAVGFAAPDAKTEAKLKFGDKEYLHRWSKDDQHEFTPRGQEDLERWTDMMTLNRYRDVVDGEGLAAKANAVLELYKSNRAMVLRTDSVPRTTEKPAEFLIVVLFPNPNFIEATLTRFKISDGIGTSMVYSHREYGSKVGDQMSAWLKANCPTSEKALMDLDKIPVPDVAKQ